jgi:hypothetical protein
MRGCFIPPPADLSIHCRSTHRSETESVQYMDTYALSAHAGSRLAEIGFLLILFAGIWLAAAQIPRFRMEAARTIVAGLALALAGVFLIIATHWGHFG